MQARVIIFFLSLISALSAQPPGRYYGSFGGPGDDIGYSAKQLLDEHYIVTGSSTSGPSHTTDLYLAKIHKMAGGIWDRYYGGTGNDVGKSVIQLVDSSFVIAGFTNSYGAGGYDVFLLRVDKNADVLWQRTFGGSDWEFGSDLVLGPDGNIFVVGNTYSFGSGKKDGLLLKYDLQGNLLKQKTLGGPENDELRSIIVTNDQQLAAVGSTESRGDLDGDGYFVKLDLDCDTIFTRTFGGPFKDYACDLVQKDVTGNYDYVIGGAKTYSAYNSKTHAYAYRISTAGTFVSDTSYFNNGGDEEFTSVCNSLHLPMLTAFVRSAAYPTYAIQADIVVLRPDGSPYKMQHVGGSKDEFAYSIEATKDMGYLTVGSTASHKSKNIDVLFMKHDSTVYVYSLELGMMETSGETRPLICYLENKQILLQFREAELPGLIRLYDLTGKLLKEIRELQERTLIDLNDLQPSVYLLNITGKKGAVFHAKLLLK